MFRTAIIGINAFVHDTATCLVDASDGRVLYALAEERLTNLKHCSRFPIGTLRQALEIAEKAGCAVTDVAINSDPSLFISGRLAPFIRELVQNPEQADFLVSRLISLLPFPDYYLPAGYSFATQSIDESIASLNLSPSTRNALKSRLLWHYNWAVKNQFIHAYCRQLLPHARLHAIPHHRAHAGSAFFSCGFPEATILVMDGQGESDAISIFSADTGGMKLVSSTGYPLSLGLFYLTATNHLGFSHGDEFKVMGMAAYGRPTLFERLSSSINVTQQGQLHFQQTECLSLIEKPSGTRNFLITFGPEDSPLIRPREPGAPLEQAHFDFAAAVQMTTEKIGVELARAAIALTGNSNLVLTGGVALNGLMNERIRRESGCANIFVYPASGDDGTAIGAAQCVAMQNGAVKASAIGTCFYGKAADDGEITQEFTRRKINYSRPADIHATIAQALAQGKIVARFVGNSEFGPRALGHRSILADPRDANMRDFLNTRIKQRESFRPFAPACLKERVNEYFDLNCDSPFMLLICPVREAARSIIPAVVHQDGTARVQSVDRESNPDFYRIIEEFDRITGVPVVVNTSFNVNGETIVETAGDAIESFQFMDIDYLAIHDYWLTKEDNPSHELSSLSHDAYLELRRKRFADTNPDALAGLDLNRFMVWSDTNHQPLKPYQIGTALSFATGGLASSYQLAGWSNPEHWGTWSIGKAASLDIPIDPTLRTGLRIACVVMAFVTEANPEQAVTIAIDGHVIERWVFTMGDNRRLRYATIPIALLARQNPIRIDFLIRHPISPKEMGISDDPRLLGIGIEEMVLEPSSVPTAISATVSKT